MKLGAQLYSLRESGKTPEGIREVFRRVKEIGYEVVQVSGLGDIAPEELKEISEEYSLPITSTHIRPYERLLEDPEGLIREHKIFGSPVIGIGGMPTKYRTSLEGVRAFIEETRESEKKIRDAGMSLTYHNHAFEFESLAGTDIYEILLEESNFNFIHDIYWSTFAGKNPLDYISRLAGRMTDVHFKDMNPADRGICACGNGTIDFAPIIAACQKAGVQNVQVEQDNAPTFPDPFEQMAISFRHLHPLMK